MWREGPDLAVVAHLLRSRVDVLISKGGLLDGGCPMVYGEQYEDRGKIVLLLSTEENHYRAVVDTQNPHKNLQLLESLKTFVNESVVSNDNVDDGKNASKNDIRMVNSRMDAVMKMLNNLQAKYDGKIFKLEEENQEDRTLQAPLYREAVKQTLRCSSPWVQTHSKRSGSHWETYGR